MENQWKVIDDLMQRPALTSAGKELDKLDKAIESKGTEADKFRSLIYRFAIDYGCEYSLFDDSRIHYANYSNPEEGEEIVLNAFVKARSLMATMSDSANKALALVYMHDLLNAYLSVKRYSSRTETEFDASQYNIEVPDKLGLWSERIYNESFLQQYKAIRNFSVKQLQEASNHEIEKLKIGIRKELESYVMSNRCNLVKDYSYLFKKLGNSHFTLISDYIVEKLANNALPVPLDTPKNKLLALFSLPWNENKDAFPYCEAELFYNMYSLHKSRGEKEVLPYYFIKFGDYLNVACGFDTRASNEAYQAACDKFLEEFAGNEFALSVATKKSELMLIEYQTKCLPEEMDKDLPKKIIDFCDKYINAFPKSRDLEGLKGTKEIVLNPVLSVEIEKDNISSKENVVLHLKYANIDKVNVKLYRCTLPYEECDDYNKAKYLKNSVPVKLDKSEYDLKQSNYYIKEFVDVKIAERLEPGLYVIDISSPSLKEMKHYSPICLRVSDIYLQAIQQSADDFIVYAVDRTSGHPLSNVTLKAYSGGRRQSHYATATTDNNGRAVIKYPSNYNYYGLRVSAQKGKDTYGSPVELSKQTEHDRSANCRCEVFTDRSIYRPGQKMQIKVIGYESSATKDIVLANKNIELSVKDSQYKEIFTQSKTFNEFGSASFEVEIPSDCMNGQFVIHAKVNDKDSGFKTSTYKFVQVEEYVRPKYEVKITSVDGEQEFGKEITLNGVATFYSGEPIANASVDIKLWKRARERFYVEETLDSIITTQTDSEGKFAIKLLPQADKENSNRAVNYKFDGDIVSPSGEPLKLEYSIDVYPKDLITNALVKGEMPKSFDASETINVTLVSETHSGKPRKNTITLCCINEDKGKKILGKYEVSGRMDIAIPLKDVGVGLWEISAECDEAKSSDKELPPAQMFVVYDKKSSVCPYRTNLWVSEEKFEANEGEDLELYIGSQAKDARILYLQRINNKKPNKEEWITLDNSMKKIVLKYKDLFTTQNHDEITTVYLSIVSENKREVRMIKVSKKPADYSLPIKITSFRDNILPGSKQKWSLQVEKQFLPAEILALMYDASLDVYEKNTLPSISHYSFYCNSWNLFASHCYPQSEYMQNPLKRGTYNYFLTQPEGIWSNAVGAYCKSRPTRVYGSRTFSVPQKNMRAAAPAITLCDNDIAEDEVAAPKMEAASDAGGVAEMDIPKQNITPRENFAETAFFYPNLITDAEGTVQFEFETPQSLTSWNFMVFAHNKELKSGTTEKVVKTSQPVTIRASLPRFMRRGDKQTLTAMVSRLDANVKNAKVSVKVIDGLTDDILYTNSRNINFHEAIETVNFAYDVPETISVAVIEFYVETEGFSDGERHKLAVLNNCEHVIKSVNLIAKGGAEKSFDIPQSDKDALNKEITVQYSANAAWNVITALPSASYSEEDAISLASALYVNALAGNIAQTYPEIKRQVQKWSEETSKEQKQPPLENNNQLKTILLNETPWVVDAERETKWRNELVNTLDSDRAKKECIAIVKKLKELQLSDGGFSWYKGSRSSYYTTLVVCEMLEKMHRRNLLTSVDGAKEMMAKALKFLDEKTVEEYERYYKRLKEKDKYVSEYDLHAMMIRIATKDIHKPSAKVNSIYNEYLDVANKKWVDLTLYGKATLAMLNYDFDKKSLSKKIIEAMREGYTQSDTDGIYWKSNQDFNRIYSSAILRQAICIRAFAKIDPRKQEIEAMKQWLIVRKSRTMWESNIATVDAIDAVLFESDFIASTNLVSNLTMGDVRISASTGAGNEGFVQYSAKVDDVPKTIEVKQAEGAVGIGAVYLSYDSKLENITANASGISVEKQTYLISRASSGKDREVLKEIKKGDALKVGDRVKVVVKIHNSQDLDFVALKDRRPACLEPERMLSGYRFGDGAWYYQTLKDASMMYMFDRLQKGTYVFEYIATVTHAGEYQSGTATIQSVYCPSYNANSKAERIYVNNK